VSEQRDIARLLMANADLLERRGFAASATLERRAAQMLDEIGQAVETGCARCGAELVQPRTGRPRRFCTSCSPPRLLKTREKSRLAA